MTKKITISEINNSVQTLIALTKNGDEIVLEENGKPLAKVTPIVENEQKPRVAGRGTGNGYFISDDFNDELPDEFWDWEK